jgi:hypothetical protein
MDILVKVVYNQVNILVKKWRYKMDKNYGLKYTDKFNIIKDLYDTMIRLINEVYTENKQLKVENKQLKEGFRKQENKKWRPKGGEYYYYLGDCGYIYEAIASFSESDIRKYRIRHGNCFKTREEAEQYRENLNIKAELKALADELNGGEVIVWTNSKQKKYYIFYNHTANILETCADIVCQNQSSIYCLDKNFLNEAINQIGEQRLIDLIKSGV